jgi:hypothetical protein
MNRKMTYLAVASAVLALSTALSAGAEPFTTDAQTQAGVLLTARSQFRSAQPILHAGAAADAQSQARAVVSGGDRSPKSARIVADQGIAPLPAHASTQLAHRGFNRSADAQSMAATVLLGRGA